MSCARTRFDLIFFCDRQKFNLTGGFSIFLLMVTGRGTIFICSAVAMEKLCALCLKTRNLGIIAICLRNYW